MCGIVGYIGPDEATDFLLEGLRRLEYRGYDSSGVATIHNGELAITKTTGRIDQLAAKLKAHPTPGNIGLGHTRWATHGPATDVNAHPHVGGNRVLAVVHNGVIENFRFIKQKLTDEGYSFASATDTEVIAQLLDFELKQCLSVQDPNSRVTDPYNVLVQAMQTTLSQLRGTYGLVAVFRDWPEVLVAARLGSPLVIGIGKGEHFIASDQSPLVGHTDKIVYLADHEVAVVTAEAIRVVNRDAGDVPHDVRLLEADESQVALDGYPHYMLKEIFEQPETVRNAMRGRLDYDAATAVFGGLNLSPRPTAGCRSICPHRLWYKLACGIGGRIHARSLRPRAGRSRIRQRTPLSQSPAHAGYVAVCHYSERRNDRHAGGHARGEA